MASSSVSRLLAAARWVPSGPSASLSLRSYLMLMALALLLPSLLFTTLLMAHAARQERTRVEQRLIQVAGDLAEDVDREFDRLLTVLDGLASSINLKRRDLALFHEQAKAAVRRLGTVVLLLDEQSNTVLNTRVPFGTELPVSSSFEAAATARATGAPVVSHVFLGKVSQQYVFDVIMPLKVPGLDGYVLVMAVTADQLLEILGGLKLPQDWTTGVVDRKGIIVARSPEHAQFVGKPLNPRTLVDSRRATGVFDSTDMAGNSVLRAVAESKRSGWLVSANVRRAVVDNNIRTSLLAVAGAGLALFGLGIGLATLAAKTILAPVQALARSTGSSDSNSLSALPLQSPVREVNEVASALRAAGDEMASRLARLEQSEQRLAAAQESADLAYVDLDMTTGRLSVSATYSQIMGFTPPSDFATTVPEFLARVHPDDIEGVKATFAEAMATAGHSEITFRIVRPDGSRRWIHSRADTIVDAVGRPYRMLGTNLDVTRLKAQEEQIQFLMHEVAHRSKNQLAVIQSLADQTSRTATNFEDFRSRFALRLQGLAILQDVLITQDWEGADLSALMAAQLKPFVLDEPDRIERTGPPLLLVPDASQAFGMAFHELATNAAKYGALSNGEGRIHITWSVGMNQSGQELSLQWRESGGPPVSPPKRKGFGTIVFERMIDQSHGGQATATYDTAGVVWTITVPLDSVISA